MRGGPQVGSTPLGSQSKVKGYDATLDRVGGLHCRSLHLGRGRELGKAHMCDFRNYLKQKLTIKENFLKMSV